MDMNFNLETSRLIFRPWSTDDLDHYLTLAKDIGYICFSSPGQFPTDEKSVREKIAQRADSFRTKKMGRFLIFSKETKELMGCCGLQPFKIEGREEIELGYRLRLQYWEKGYATEAAKAVIADGFSRLQLNRIVAFAVPQNRPSIRIIEKLGFKYLKNFKHVEIPHALYELVK
jgi:[ribosomal protein S5]-alanine N-acetyltransferase